MRSIKKVCYVLLGVLLAAAIFCVAVGIGCAINGVTFGEQIANWFGTNAETIVETTEEVVETVTQLPGA